MPDATLHDNGEIAFLCHDNCLRDRVVQERLGQICADAINAVGEVP